MAITQNKLKFAIIIAFMTPLSFTPVLNGYCQLLIHNEIDHVQVTYAKKIESSNLQSRQAETHCYAKSAIDDFISSIQQLMSSEGVTIELVDIKLIQFDGDQEQSSQLTSKCQ